ncbi:MAG: hypothetical protein DK306_002461, partial [Chloroflexi bacterium]
MSRIPDFGLALGVALLLSTGPLPSPAAAHGGPSLPNIGVAQAAFCDGPNLITNGDAEAGPANTTPGGTTAPDGWETTGSFRILAYGTSTFPALSDPGPPNSGGALFVAGPSSPASTITQTISLAGNAAAIADGRLTYALCGWLGGFGGQDDAATLTATFRSQVGAALSVATIGPVLDADRGGVTALIERSTTGTIPTGTLTVEIVLTAERVAGNSNDGYADNLVFSVAEDQLAPPPDPTPSPPPAAPGESPLVALTLDPGWHLVGWSGATTGTGAFDFLTGDFEAGFTFDARTKQFRQFRPTAPDLLNTLNQLAFGDGIWIRVTEPSTWLQPAPWWARDVPLRSGFNLVLWTGPNDTPVAEAFGGLGSALVSAFTWNSQNQAFRSYGPDRPDFLNTARVLNYGDGVWIDVNRDVVWHQPALQRIGTQIALFFHNISRLEGGQEIDMTDAVLAAASRDLGPPVPLQFGLVFQESLSLRASARAENGAAISNVSARFGIISRSLGGAQSPDVTIVDDAAGVFLGERFAVPALITSPHLEDAFYNLDLNDILAIDLSDVSGLDVGDEIRFRYVHTQTLELRPPLSESGLSDAQVFARRWNAGDLAILSVDGGVGTRVVLTQTDATVSAGSGFATAQQLSDHEVFLRAWEALDAVDPVLAI